MKGFVLDRVALPVTRVIAILALATIAVHTGSDVSQAAPPPRAPAAPDRCQVWFIPFFGGWLAGASWNDRSNDETGFIVEWRINNPAQRGTTTTQADATSTSITTIGSGRDVRCRVRALNANGESGWSNWASGTP